MGFSSTKPKKAFFLARSRQWLENPLWRQVRELELWGYKVYFEWEEKKKNTTAEYMYY